jgi:nucleoside-diphosphate-sugar epimerase
MKVLVTGATGFIGRHVVTQLLKNKHKVLCVVRDKNKLDAFDWSSKVEILQYDLHQKIPDFSGKIKPGALIHLAWSGLPNYKSMHHMEENLPADMRFLRAMFELGIKQILVTGTCFEFGMQNGPLGPGMPTFPHNPYALAKDTLRKWLQEMQKEKEFILQWVRLFYIYGPNQNTNSILSQLDRVIDAGDPVFNMSGGEQLRDYLPVSKVSEYLAFMVDHPEIKGVHHCCSGTPISIHNLVLEHLKKRKAKIKLNLGIYPYNDFEAMAFWGSKD